MTPDCSLIVLLLPLPDPVPLLSSLHSVGSQYYVKAVVRFTSIHIITVFKFALPNIPKKRQCSVDSARQRRVKQKKSKQANSDNPVSTTCKIPESPVMPKLPPQSTPIQKQNYTKPDSVCTSALAPFLVHPTSFESFEDALHLLDDADIDCYMQSCVSSLFPNSVACINPLVPGYFDIGEPQIAIPHVLTTVSVEWRTLYFPYRVDGNHWVLYVANRGEGNDIHIRYVDPKKGARRLQAEALSSI